MDISKHSFGSKNPKKTITVNVTWKHIFLFFLVLMGIVYIVLVALSNFIAPETAFTCVDGSKEVIEQGVEYYCGVHYTAIENLVSEEEYKLIGDIINGE